MRARMIGQQPLFDTEGCRNYASKLTRLGVPADPAEVFTSLAATVRWVLTTMPGAAVFPIGEAPLHDALTAAGVEICDDPARRAPASCARPCSASRSRACST